MKRFLLILACLVLNVQCVPEPTTADLVAMFKVLNSTNKQNEAKAYLDIVKQMAR